MNKTVGDKRFLNKTGFHSIASIAYELELNDNKDETQPFPDGTLWFSDCYRTLSLELDVDTDESLENTLHKLDMIIEVATKAKEDAVEINVLYKKQMKKYKKKKRKKGVL